MFAEYFVGEVNADPFSFRSIVDELKPDFVDVGQNSREPECVSLSWSADGQTLFGGFSDDLVRVWSVVSV